MIDFLQRFDPVVQTLFGTIVGFLLMMILDVSMT
jgi:hypothetical protein